MKLKKKICIINPNTSSKMTSGIGKVAKKIISSKKEFEPLVALNPTSSRMPGKPS